MEARERERTVVVLLSAGLMTGGRRVRGTKLFFLLIV